MKHACSAALDRLEPILQELRKIGALKEKSRGVFYLGSRAFLHFHEQGDAFFADVRMGDDFERLSIANSAERTDLLRKVRAAVGRNPRKPKKNAKRTS